MDIIPSMLAVIFVACFFNDEKERGDVDIPLGRVQPIISSREMRGKLSTGVAASFLQPEAITGVIP